MQHDKAATALKKTFPAGVSLFHEGDQSHCMYLIQKGTISIRKSKGAAQVEIARLYSNEVLGELSFFDRMPRSASAIALTDVEVLELPFDALDKIYNSIPDYMKTIISAVADRLRKANDTIRRLQKSVVPGDHIIDEKAVDLKTPDTKPTGEVPNDIPAAAANAPDGVKPEEK